MSITAEQPSPPARRRGRPVSQRKRQAVLEAARREFGASGFRDANMDAIAAAANVSKRTLYNHFASKELLFRAVVADLVAVISGTVGIRYDPAAPLRRQLEQYARDSIRLVRNTGNLHLLRAVIAEHIRNPALVEPAFATYWKAEYGFADWIKAACADRRLAVKDPTRAGHIFASLVRGVIIWPAVLGRTSFTTERLTAAAAEAIDMFLVYYAPDRATAPPVRKKG